MSDTLFDPAPSPDIADARARTDAARCIRAVAQAYRRDAERASAAGLVPVARLYWAVVDELGRAARLAVEGTDPGDKGGHGVGSATHDFDPVHGGCRRCAGLPEDGPVCDAPAVGVAR